MRAVVVCFAAVTVSFGASGEDTIRCRNGRLVNVGMTVSEVSSRCGQPTSRTVEEIPVMTRLATGAARQTGTTHAERWIYRRGQGQFDAMLTFEDDTLRRIDLITEP